MNPDLRAEWFAKQITWLPYNPVLGVRHPAELGDPKKETTITEWRATIQEHFPDLLRVSETALSMVSELLIQEVHNPISLTLVDVPASGKTICINFFKGLPNLTYATDNFTPNAFVSHIAGRSKKALAEIDLLPRVRHKMMLVPDMAPVFGGSDDQLLEKLSLLTRVLDGQGLSTDKGVYGQRGYEGDFLFMMLGASTPIPLRVWDHMGGAGHRMYFLGVDCPDMTEDAELLEMGGMGHMEREALCRMATHDFLKTLWKQYPNGIQWNRDGDGRETMRWILRFSRFLAHHRGLIRVWMDRETRVISHTSPLIEKPKRIRECLLNLARGHALVEGRHAIQMSDLEILLPVILDTAPEPRPKLVRHLLMNNGKITADDVMKILSVGKDSAAKELRKLQVLGIIEADVGFSLEGVVEEVGPRRGSLHPSFGWFMNDEMVALLGKCGVKKT